MIEATLVLVAAIGGLAGGAIADGVRRVLRRRGRQVASLEVGQRIAEPDGREWQVVGRRIDVQVGRVPTLSIDLGLRRDPS